MNSHTPHDHVWFFRSSVNSCEAVKSKEKNCNSQAQAVGRDFPLCVYVGIGNVFVCECGALCFCRCPESDRSQSYRLCASQPTQPLGFRQTQCLCNREETRRLPSNGQYKSELWNRSAYVRLKDIICFKQLSAFTSTFTSLLYRMLSEVQYLRGWRQNNFQWKMIIFILTALKMSYTGYCRLF